MALSYIRFTELDAVSSVATNDILPVVETVTNINKKITIGNLNNSLPLGEDVTVLKANSGNWESTYNNTISNSANWTSVYNSVTPVSASWESVYTTVQQNSAGWESVEASVLATSGSWNSVYSSVNSTSASWNSVYTNINTTSAQYTQSFAGATATTNGVAGVVPRSLSGQQVSYLKGDATWGTPGAFQVNVTTNTLPLCTHTTLNPLWNTQRWIYPLSNSFGPFGASWDYRMYNFAQIRFFRPMVISQIACYITTVTTPSPSDFMRIVVTSNNEERNTPFITLREIVSVPGILNTPGIKVFDLPTSLLIEPGAIWVGAIMSSGYTNVSNNAVLVGDSTFVGGNILNCLLAGLVGDTAVQGVGRYVGDGCVPFIQTNRFAVTYNASNAAPANWDTERQTYETTSNAYWSKVGNITQSWCVR